MPVITTIELVDLRFPISDNRDGSDAMNKDADYSAAYLRLVADNRRFYGCGFTFTIERGNDICLQLMEMLSAGLRRAVVNEGYRHIKLKVQANLVDDERRLDIARSVIGPDMALMINHVVVSGSVEGRVAEFVDHLHEHFVDPCRVRNGAYVLLYRPGYSAEIKAETPAAWAWPGGTEWAQRREAMSA